MSKERGRSALSRLDLDNLSDKRSKQPSAVETDSRSTMPIREAPPPREGFDQVNVKMRMSSAARFRRLARDNGSQAKLIEKMMDLWEQQSR